MENHFFTASFSQVAGRVSLVAIGNKIAEAILQ
jgi:hypothetical protein